MIWFDNRQNVSMKNLIYILIVFTLTSCIQKSNQSSQNDTIPNDTTPSVIVEQEPTEKEDIVLPNPPDWLTPDKLDIVKEWKDDAKLELYTYMDFFNSISSLVSTTTQPNSQNIRTISTDKQHISLHEIFNDTTIYYVAIFTNPPFTDFFFGYQQYTKKDNYLFLAKSNPVIWVDGISSICESYSLYSNSEKFHLTNNGEFFFSIDIKSANSEYGGEYNGEYDDESTYYEEADEENRCRHWAYTNESIDRYFFDCKGHQINISTIEYTGSTSIDFSYIISETNISIKTEISTTDFSNGFPNIIENTNESRFDIRDSTQIDSAYTVTYKYNINTLKYEPIGSKDKQ